MLIVSPVTAAMGVLLWQVIDTLEYNRKLLAGESLDATLE